jgi:Domain of unknown function (DUF4177)
VLTTVQDLVDVYPFLDRVFSDRRPQRSRIGVADQVKKILDWHSSGGRGNYGRRMANRYQYMVVELREGMIGGKMSGGQLEKVLNEHAAQGWQLKAITSVEVKGRVGPGGVEGLLVTFERPVG